MWKLIIADSFHINRTGFHEGNQFILFSIYFNVIIRMNDSYYMIILSLLLLFLMSYMFLAPIRVAKGLYLCPLTENDRKKYLKMVCFIRFVIHEAMLGVILILLRLVYQFEFRMLLLIFLSISIEYMTILLLGGFYNPDMVKRQYFFRNKLPIPKKYNHCINQYKTPRIGFCLLIIAFILSCIGTFLPGFIDSYDDRWLFYYVPALSICFICLFFYFLQYFDLLITVNANHEMYSYTHKKKAGVFHAD